MGEKWVVDVEGGRVSVSLPGAVLDQIRDGRVDRDFDTDLATMGVAWALRKFYFDEDPDTYKVRKSKGNSPLTRGNWIQREGPNARPYSPSLRFLNVWQPKEMGWYPGYDVLLGYDSNGNVIITHPSGHSLYLSLRHLLCES